MKAADPIPGNSVRINIVNDENAVVDTVDYTNQNAQVGQTLGSTDGGSASLDPADEKPFNQTFQRLLRNPATSWIAYPTLNLPIWLKQSLAVPFI